MKKNLNKMKELSISILFLSLISFSCSKSDLQPPEIIDSQNSVNLKSAGDLKHDVLGQGYDITGIKDDYSSVRPAVIDITAFKLAQPARVAIDLSFSEVYTSNFQENSKSFSSSIAVDTKTNATVEPFSGSITKFFSGYRSYSSQYSFATIENVVTHARIYLNADNSMLQNYLTDPFKADLLTKSADALVKIYGTHVLYDIKTGGKMHMIYKSTTTQTDKKETVKAGAAAAVTKLFGWQAGIEYNSTLVNKNAEAHINYQSSGGTTSLSGSVDVKTGIPTINLGAWSTSIHSGIPGSASFISTDYSKIIPIYELVADPTKKAALKLAVENYINSKKLDMRSPFFRYYEESSDGHFYTTDFSEINGAYGWLYEGIEGYLYNIQVPNTIRLYRYYHSKGRDHYYTTNFNELRYGNRYWTYESNFFYYVYPYPAEGTVKLWQYYASSRAHHFYSTTPLPYGKDGYYEINQTYPVYIFPK